MRLTSLLAVIAVPVLSGAAAIGIVTQPFVEPATSQPPPVSTERLAAHVKRLSVDFYPRSQDRFDTLELAAAYIRGELIAIGANVSVQPVDAHGKRFQNVIARFGPDVGPVLVIGAHYDSHGDAEGNDNPLGYSPETHTPGADDNASGVAGLIELARLLHDRPPTRPVELVAYTLEEPPDFRTEHMGSVWHARSLVEAKRPVQMMVALEMIGCFIDTEASQQFPVPGMGLLYPDQGNFIALVGRLSDFGTMRRAKALMAGTSPLPVYSINAPSLIQGVDFSDHRSYWNEGIPALMVTDTSFYRNTQYHQAGDTFDKLDYRRMAMVVQGVYALAQGL